MPSRPSPDLRLFWAYLSHYTHSIAIPNSGLIALDEAGVTFRYKDYRCNGRGCRPSTGLAAAISMLRRQDDHHH